MAGDATVAELVGPFEISQPAVSKHLRVLEGAGLISRSRVATARYSHLEAAPLKEANEWMQKYTKFWTESFDKLDAALAEYFSNEQPTDQSTAPGRVVEMTEHTIPEVPVAADTDVFITRSFDAPRDVVWRFFTEPALLATWSGPSKESPCACGCTTTAPRPGSHFTLHQGPFTPEFRDLTTAGWQSSFLKVDALLADGVS